MPKRNHEINKFNYGIVSTPSSSDTASESASYSKNIENQASSGRLQGTEGSHILTTEGFVPIDADLSINPTPYINSVILPLTNTYVKQVSSSIPYLWLLCFCQQL